jgi:hypothetical protein
MTRPAQRLAVACGALLFLVACLGWFVVLAGSPGTVDVLARPEARNPAAKAGQVAVSWIVVDGTRVRPVDVVASGTWRQEAWGFCSTNDAPCGLRLVGRQITIAFVRSPWSGAVEVRGGGSDSDSLHDLFGEPGSEALVVDVAVDQDWLPGGLAMLAACLPILLLVRPWRSDRRLHGLLFAHIVVSHVVVWACFPIGTNNDAVGYLTAASTLPSRPDYFPPGYPWFVAACAAVCPAAPVAALTAVQHAAMVVALGCLHAFARAMLPPGIAAGVLVLLAGLPDTLCLPQTLLSEALAVPASAIAVWAAWRAWRGGRARNIGLELLAGVAIGVAALARVTPFLVLLPPVYCLARAASGGVGALWRCARVAAIAGAMLAGVVAWFGASSGEWRLASSSGLHLFNRVVDEQHLVDPSGTAGARYLAAMAGQSSPFVPHWEAGAVLDRAGLSWGQRSELLSAVAQEGLRLAPFAFVGHSLSMSLALLAADPAPTLPHGPFDPNAAAWECPPLWPAMAPAARRMRLQLDAWFGCLRPGLAVVALLALFGLRFVEGRKERLAMVLLAVGGAFVACSVEHYQPRYALGLTPFTALLWPFGHRRLATTDGTGGGA